ncbi:hypothetical protein [Flavobacterium xylosi]|uniref:hypothetical protein n=1 Tax=Flavobacterium xylosi TaxID=3230415 RepID=UPI0036D2145A
MTSSLNKTVGTQQVLYLLRYFGSSFDAAINSIYHRIIAVFATTVHRIITKPIYRDSKRKIKL